MGHRIRKREALNRAGMRIRRIPLMVWLVVATGLIGIGLWVFLALSAQDTKQQLDTTQEEKSQTEQKLSEFAERMIAACTGENAARDELQEIGLCQEAVEAQQEVEEPGPAVPFRIVRDAVAAYFADHPVKDGKTPTPEELLPLIRQVYNANPPEDGKTPTTEELLTLIRQVYAANPPERGPQGEKGDQGRPPTPPEIRASVDAYCADRPDGDCVGPRGPEGEPGQPGTDGATWEPVGARYERDDEGACHYIVSFARNGVGEPVDVPATAPDNMCEPDAPPEPDPTG